jgi:hypothetical protein
MNLSLTAPSSLTATIPSEDAIRKELSRNMAEARLLRRMLRIARARQDEERHLQNKYGHDIIGGGLPHAS